MKEKEYIFMKAVKETLSMNKFIQVSSSTHKMLIEDVEALEEKIKYLESKTYNTQEEIVGQKTIAAKNLKLEKGLLFNLSNLKNKRK